MSAQLPPVDTTEDQPAALVLTVLTFVVFAGLVAALLTRTVHQDATGWVGVGLVGLASLLFGVWAYVVEYPRDFGWAERLGGDLLLVGAGVFCAIGGLTTFAASVV